jgi:hypothetical protein
VARVQTVDAIWARRTSEALRAAGLPADDIVKRAGIQPYLLNQDSARVAFSQHAKLLHLAAQVTGRGSFGLELAAKGTDPRDSGLLVYAALSSKTFGEALKVVQRYMHVLNEAVDVDMELSSAAVRLEFDFASREDHGILTRAEAYRAAEEPFELYQFMLARVNEGDLGRPQVGSGEKSQTSNQIDHPKFNRLPQVEPYGRRAS